MADRTAGGLPRESAGAVAGEDGVGGLRKDLKIEPKGPGAGVADIEPDHVVELDAAAPFDLPEAGNAGLDGEEAAAVPEAVAGQPGPFREFCTLRPILFT